MPATPASFLPRTSIARGTRSWWLDEALQSESASAALAPLRGEQRFDVAIVGGGFTGLWTALLLRERHPHASVALIEQDICGSGASGMNGGKVHGYWSSLGSMAKALGDQAALDMARAGSLAQDAIRAFATAPGRDVWWKEGGQVRVAASAAQSAKIDSFLATARRLGVPDSVYRLSREEVGTLCLSPVFRDGLFFPEGANLQPARLARAMRAEALRQGVAIFEHTPMVGLDAGAPLRVRTTRGAITAHDVVLATNAALAAEPEVRRHLTLFSSYAVMSAPAPDALERSGWHSDVGFADLRMFLHYFRRTPDARVLMGSGSGPIAFGASFASKAVTGDVASMRRAESGLRRLLPEFADVPIDAAWGGVIDVSADRYPFVTTRQGSRVHLAAGFSGHGINPTYIAAQCLVSRILGANDTWSRLPLATRKLPALPPEPIRCLGGRLVRSAILACEAAEDQGQRPPITPRLIAALPERLGIKLGTR